MENYSPSSINSAVYLLFPTLALKTRCWRAAALCFIDRGVAVHSGVLAGDQMEVKHAKPGEHVSLVKRSWGLVNKRSP